MAKQISMLALTNLCNELLIVAARVRKEQEAQEFAQRLNNMRETFTFDQTRAIGVASQA
jgi:hypothetical protein